MVPKKVLVSWLFVFSAAYASLVSRGTGKTTLKFSTRININDSTNLPEKDRARARALARLHERDTNDMSLSAVNAVSFYTAQVGIGTPPTYRSLLLDTGSANTWVGAENRYIPSNTSSNTEGTFFVLYGSGAVFGEEWLDTITLGPDLVVPHQSFGVANQTFGMHTGFDGILGLGPVDLTTGTVSNAVQVPTVVDNLHAQGSIQQEVLGIYLTPASQSEHNGELTFGGYDESVITRTVNYVPITTTFPASRFWGIDQSITYGNTTILPSTAGIVDTGTTLILIATAAFQKYQSLTGATMDAATGLLTLTPSQYANLKTLSFNIGGGTYDLIPNAQIWPRALNTAMNGNSKVIYPVVSDIGYPDGAAFDFINGYTFLERYYSVFDTTSHRFGISETVYANAETN